MEALNEAVPQCSVMMPDSNAVAQEFELAGCMGDTRAQLAALRRVTSLPVVSAATLLELYASCKGGHVSGRVADACTSAPHLCNKPLSLSDLQ